MFAGRHFAADEEILRFHGREISPKDKLAKGAVQGNPLQVGPETYIDIEPPGLFANHSCCPNAGIRADVVLIALRDILPGEEIRYDYSTTMWEGIWTMQCLCGSKRCRGLVGDFHLLATEIQSEYVRLGIVQRFIIDRLRNLATAGQAIDVV